MKTDSEAVHSVDIPSVSDVVSELRAAFRSVDFESAEVRLVAREDTLRQELRRLELEKQSITELRELDRIEIFDLRAELQAARARAGAAEERREKGSEVSELKWRRDEAERWKRNCVEAEIWKRNCVEAEAAAERWHRRCVEAEAEVERYKRITAAELTPDGIASAVRNVASERSEPTGENKSPRNAEDSNLLGHMEHRHPTQPTNVKPQQPISKTASSPVKAFMSQFRGGADGQLPRSRCAVLEGDLIAKLTPTPAPSMSTSKRKRSTYWQFFDEVILPVEVDGVTKEVRYGRCLKCRVKVCADSKRCGTSGLKSHHKRCDARLAAATMLYWGQATINNQ